MSLNWCLFVGKQDLSVQSMASTTSSKFSAGLPCGVVLWEKNQITVSFTDATIHLLRKWSLTAKDILQLANKWHQPQNKPNCIPEFIGCRVGEDADIMVELNGKV